MTTATKIYDRTWLIDDLDEKCFGADAKSAVLWCAHKVGKTHLLRHLRERQSTATECVFYWMDIDSLIASNPKGDTITDSVFLKALLEKIRRAMEHWIAEIADEEEPARREMERASERLAEIGAEDSAEASRVRELREAYRSVLRELESYREVGGLARTLLDREEAVEVHEVQPILSELRALRKPIILIIDDFHRLLRESELSRKLFLLLRGANNKREIISLVSSTINLMDPSLHHDKESGDEDRASLFNHFLYRSLAPFDELKALGFLDFVEPKEPELTDNERSYLAGLGGGSPHFLKVAKEEFVRAGRPGKPESRQAFQTQRLERAYRPGFAELWNRCNTKKQRLLRRIHSGSVPGGSFDLDELIAEGYVRETDHGPVLFSDIFGDFIERESTRGFLGRRNDALDKVRILFLAANPRDMSQNDLDEEYRAIQAQIKQLEGRKIELVSRWAVRAEDLIPALLDERPQIVHFSGHGSEANEIYLQGEDGEARPLPADAIEHLGRVFSEVLRVVTFSACFSKAQAEAVTRHVDFAVGMSGEIGDKASREFASIFYLTLGRGESLERALDVGRAAIKVVKGVEEVDDSDMPQLLKRKGAIDPAEAVLLRRSSD